jgi:mRNA interferase MazF
MVKNVNQFEVYLVALDPTVGSEIKKTRPALVISPDDMNDFLRTVIIVPMTSANKTYPTRVPIDFEGKSGFVVLDQIRTLDKSRLLKKLGVVDITKGREILEVLGEMFSI